MLYLPTQIYLKLQKNFILNSIKSKFKIVNYENIFSSQFYGLIDVCIKNISTLTH